MTTIVYTVEPGDTLWGIAQHSGTTVNDIARYNGLAFPIKYIRASKSVSRPRRLRSRCGTLYARATRYGQ